MNSEAQNFKTIKILILAIYSKEILLLGRESFK